jgi:hypothetical protein
MRRPKAHDRRYKKAHWTQNQKLQAVSTYLMLGNMAETAVVTGIPLPTLKMWKVTDWFKDYALQLQAEEVQQMSSSMKKIIDKSLKAVEDRLDLGDAQFDQRTGAIVRVPVKAHVALKITTDLMARQDKLSANPVKEQIESTIDDRLLKLSEEFARFAGPKMAKGVPVDVEVKEVFHG